MKDFSVQLGRICNLSTTYAEQARIISSTIKRIEEELRGLPGKVATHFQLSDGGTLFFARFDKTWKLYWLQANPCPTKIAMPRPLTECPVEIKRQMLEIMDDFLEKLSTNLRGNIDLNEEVLRKTFRND